MVDMALIDATYLALSSQITNIMDGSANMKLESNMNGQKIYLKCKNPKKKKTPQTLRPKELFSFYLD